jgi:hypothetical protein
MKMPTIPFFHRIPLDAPLTPGVNIERSDGTTWGLHLVLQVRGRRRGSVRYDFNRQTGIGRSAYWLRISWLSPAGRSSPDAAARGGWEMRRGHYYRIENPPE